MSKSLPFLDLKNGHDDIKLKFLMLTCMSIMKSNENRPCLSTKYLTNASKIYLEKAENFYFMLLR